MPTDWITSGCEGSTAAYRYTDDGMIELLGIGVPVKHLPSGVIARADSIWRYSDRYSVPAALAVLGAGVMSQESGGSAGLTSPSGAVGPMQVMPSNGGSVAERLLGRRLSPDEIAEPETNIAFGMALLADSLRRYDGNVARALAGYNFGRAECGGSNPWGLVVDDDYVSSVMAYVNGAVRELPDPSPPSPRTKTSATALFAGGALAVLGVALAYSAWRKR